MKWNPEVTAHIVDAHCHPTDANVIDCEVAKQLSITICAQSSHAADQDKVAELARSCPTKVIPCFGYHPWFSHQIMTDPSLTKEEHYRRLFLSEMGDERPDHMEAFNKLLPLLPEPTPLASVLDEVTNHLMEFPDAMVGEVGLDRVFRVPYNYFAEERELTPFTVPIEHQVAVLRAQLNLAMTHKRNVSLHSVKAGKATLYLFKELADKEREAWFRISIDMHSCSLSVESWRDAERQFPNVFLSLSIVINSRHAYCKKLLASCAPDRILVESDYNDVTMVTSQTLEMVQLLAEVRGWSIEQEWVEEVEPEARGVVHRLEDNWKRFRKGTHQPPESKRRRKKRLLESESESEESK